MTEGQFPNRTTPRKPQTCFVRGYRDGKAESGLLFPPPRYGTVVLGRAEKKALGHLRPGAESIGFLLGLEMMPLCRLIPPGASSRAWGTEPQRWGDFLHSCKGEGRRLLLCRNAQSARFGQNEHLTAWSKPYIKQALPAAGPCKQAVALLRLAGMEECFFSLSYFNQKPQCKRGARAMPGKREQRRGYLRCQPRGRAAGCSPRGLIVPPSFLPFPSFCFFPPLRHPIPVASRPRRSSALCRSDGDGHILAPLISPNPWRSGASLPPDKVGSKKERG